MQYCSRFLFAEQRLWPVPVLHPRGHEVEPPEARHRQLLRVRASGHKACREDCRNRQRHQRDLGGQGALPGPRELPLWQNCEQILNCCQPVRRIARL